MAMMAGNPLLCFTLASRKLLELAISSKPPRFGVVMPLKRSNWIYRSGVEPIFLIIIL